MERALETYDLMSRGHFIHASPTLFHAGLKRAHLSSCFLLGSTEAAKNDAPDDPGNWHENKAQKHRIIYNKIV